MCGDAYAEELAESGVLPPCRTLAPLAPALTPREYEMMERDLGKYALYYAALVRCARDMRAAGQPAFRCLALGPGGGRLAAYCLEAGGLAGYGAAEVEVCCVEANPEAVDGLRARFRGDARVTVHCATLHPTTCLGDLPAGLAQRAGGFDVGVAELLGTFGDNEFMTEITRRLRGLLLRPGAELLPDGFSVYAAPVHAPSTRAYLLGAGRPLDCGYISGLARDCTVLAEPRLLYSRRAWEAEEVVDASVTFEWNGESVARGPPACCRPDGGRKVPAGEGVPAKRVKREDGHPDASGNMFPGGLAHHANAPEEGDEEELLEVHGFVGYFTSTLYRGRFTIDTRHTSPDFNCFHWEAYLMPLAQPLKTLAAGPCQATLRVRRVCTTTHGGGGEATHGRAVSRLHHEWACVEGPSAPELHAGRGWHNVAGADHVILAAGPSAATELALKRKCDEA